MADATTPDQPPAAPSRARTLLVETLYLAGLIVLVGVANFFAHRPVTRMKIDATKTRAYSLSERTRQLIDELHGDWTVALVMSDDAIDRNARQQLDEVLRRFTETSSRISVRRIDPGDPASLRDFEIVLDQLRGLHGDVLEMYETALDRGEEAFAELMTFAQQYTRPLHTLAEQVGDPGGEPILQRVRLLALMADRGDAVLAEIDKARRVGGDRLLPEYDVARSILAEALGQWAQELIDVSSALEGWLAEGELTADQRADASAVGRRCVRLAEQLAGASDPLARLPAMELSEIGRQLATGEAAIVIGPYRAAVIPPSQLFPASVQSTGSGLSFDQRFRGEQVIASTMRSLLVDQMPMVVFMHAQERSPLRPDEGNVDLMGVATVLRASRYDVREWNVPGGPPPEPARHQPVVWVPIPPAQRADLSITAQEQQLIDAARELLETGESLLLSFYPSLLPKWGREDPWSALASEAGIAIDTNAVLMEARRVSQDETQVERGVSIIRFPGDHAIGRALQGQRAYFTLAMPIDSVSEDTTLQPLVTVGASPDRWLEDDWNVQAERIEPDADRPHLQDDVTIVAAAERPHPVERGTQRLVVVGSGGWMLSFIADVAVNTGGDRWAPMYPGNHELMTTAVAWLSGMDELIAPGPVGANYLVGVTQRSRTAWAWVSLLIMPGACLVLGLAVWRWRAR